MAEFEDHPLRGTVSKRCSSMFYDHSYLDNIQHNFVEEYNKETNPQGCIDLGTAVNCLCEDMIEKHINTSHLLKYSKANQHYAPNEGKKELREAVAMFLTRRFYAKCEVDAEKIVITNGVTGGFDLVAHAIADPGDIFLGFGPSYNHSFWDPWERSQVMSHIIPLSSKKEASDQGWEINAQKLEKAILQCKNERKSVKGLILINPHNPLGTVLSTSTLSDILTVCKRYAIHVIVNEIYGLSVWDKSSNFVSVLSLDHIPDPSRTHIFWGISKDLGLAGCRIGAVYTFNPCVLYALKRLSYFSMASSVVQDLTTRLLHETVWLDAFFIECHKRTKEAFEWTRTRLEGMGIQVHSAQAGFFIWADFGNFLKVKTFEGEMTFFKKLIKSTNVIVLPGEEMCCREPGWGRIIYTVPRQLLEIAMSRIETFLKENTTTV